MAGKKRAQQFIRDKWKILRGDLVQIMAGKDKGQQGTVMRVVRDKALPRVYVADSNLAKRRVKGQDGGAGFTVAVEAPLHYSNVMLVDPVTKKPVRVNWGYTEDGTKVRVTKGRHASRTLLPLPQAWKDADSLDTRVGAKDTPPEEALRVTYQPGSDAANVALPRAPWEGAKRSFASLRAVADEGAAQSAQWPPHAVHRQGARRGWMQQVPRLLPGSPAGAHAACTLALAAASMGRSGDAGTGRSGDAGAGCSSGAEGADGDSEAGASAPVDGGAPDQLLRSWVGRGTGSGGWWWWTAGGLHGLREWAWQRVLQPRW